MSNVFLWRGVPVRFEACDTVASALWRQGVTDFGATARGGSHAVFCGIGQCQACLVMDQDTHVFEACLHRPQPRARLCGVMDALPSVEDLSTQAAPGSGDASTESRAERASAR